MSYNAIVIDADYIRHEIGDYPEGYGLTEEQAENILALDDATIEAAMQDHVGDSFWEMCDNIRSATIRSLAKDFSK